MKEEERTRLLMRSSRNQLGSIWHVLRSARDDDFFCWVVIMIDGCCDCAFNIWSFSCWWRLAVCQLEKCCRGRKETERVIERQEGVSRIRARCLSRKTSYKFSMHRLRPTPEQWALSEGGRRQWMEEGTYTFNCKAAVTVPPRRIQVSHQTINHVMNAKRMLLLLFSLLAKRYNV